MEFIKKDEIISLSNPGVISKQLLCPANSSSKKITITEVHLEVGANNQDTVITTLNKFGMHFKAMEQYFYQMKRKLILVLVMS